MIFFGPVTFFRASNFPNLLAPWASGFRSLLWRPELTAWTFLLHSVMLNFSSLSECVFAWCKLSHASRTLLQVYSPRHKHWPAGSAHFLDRRTSSGQYILSLTGPYGPPRYMSGHQISNSAGPNDDESQYILFARAPVPHLGSCRAVLLLQPDASMARVGVGHVNQTHWRQCLDHAARDFNANIRDASGHFSPQSTWHGQPST